MVQLEDNEQLPFQYCSNCDYEFMLLDGIEEPVEAYFCPNCGANIDDDYEEEDEEDDDEDDDDF